MLSPEQCRAARAWLNWDQEGLAKLAGVSLSTVRDFEKGRRVPIGNNLEAIQRAFEKAGVTFSFDGSIPTGMDVPTRIRERDIIIPVLEYLDESADGFMTTSDLIAALDLRFEPTGDDATILENRSDTRFSQIVRNIISHRKTSTNLVGAGYATYDKTRRGLTITDKGRGFLLEQHRSGKSGP